MLKLQFKTENAAFEGDLKWMEAGEILRAIADQASDGRTFGTIRDSNGNRIGEWSWALSLDELDPMA